MQNTMFVGLDVHKATISLAIAHGERGGEVRHWGTIPNRADHVRRLGALPSGAGRNAEVDFRGERRTNGRHWSAIGPSDNGDHVSTTDPDARLFRKSRGTGAVLCYMGHALMESRSGLVPMPS